MKIARRPRVRREPTLRSLVESGRRGRWLLRKPLLVPYELTSAVANDAAYMRALGIVSVRIEYPATRLFEAPIAATPEG